MHQHCRLFGLLLVTVVAGLASACDRSRTLPLHHLPGFVPGTRGLYAPAKIAVAPPALASSELGVVYGADGRVERRFYATTSLDRVLTKALVTQLRDAGLDAFLAPAAGRNSTTRADLILTTQFDELRVTKRIGRFFVVGDCARCHIQPVMKPILDRYFTMRSRVRMRFTLRDRHGATLCSGSVIGREDEPPARRPGESFLPLETDPAESLSVALSRAIGSLPLAPALRRILPAQRHDLPMAPHRESPAGAS